MTSRLAPRSPGTMTRAPARRQGGVALLLAVILVTTIASALALMALTMSTRGLGTARNLESMQAWYAAYSGLQYAIEWARTTPNSTCPVPPLPDELAGPFSITLNCTPHPEDPEDPEGQVQEGDAQYEIFYLEAHADNRGNLAAGTLVSRRLAASVCVADAEADAPGCLKRPKQEPEN